MFKADMYPQYPSSFSPHQQEITSPAFSKLREYCQTIEYEFDKKKIELDCYTQQGVPEIQFKSKTYKDIASLEKDLAPIEAQGTNKLKILAEAANFFFGNMMYTFDSGYCPKKLGEKLVFWARSDQNGRLYKASCNITKSLPKAEYCLTDEKLD